MMKYSMILAGVIASTLLVPVVAIARDVGGDAVSGAAKGAIIGGIAGDVGKGAAAGAAGSMLMGGVRRNR